MFGTCASQMTRRGVDRDRPRARIGAALGLLMLVAACAAPPAAVNVRSVDDVGPVAAFQPHLDRLGVAYAPPARGKAILVNVPAFELIAFEDGSPAFRSPIIVGTPANPTPMLETWTDVVRFRPTWRPTPSMIASGEYEDRLWPPGRRNPLGLAAIRLRTDMLVYLHDTNRRQLFDRDYRALSHGCIRVKRWDELVAWVLDMDLESVHRYAEGARTLDVDAPPIPVSIGYHTVFPDDSGQAVTYQDIYRRGAGADRTEDPRLLSAAPQCVEAGSVG